MDSANKRIVKNTIYLYIRMFVTMLVSLYTSRIVLQILGVSDYGLYNIVGGTITLFSFINSAMSGCTQRYLNIAFGQNAPSYTRKIFSVSQTIHIVLAVLFFIIMLVVGDYLIDNKLVIEPDRIGVAHKVLFVSLITTCVSFLSVPWEAAIIAHEKMDFYALVSLVEVFAKLGIVFLLKIDFSIDKLILYSLLLLGIQILYNISYYIYCRRKFSECTLQLQYDKPLVREMSVFVGWSMLGNLTFMLSTQGVNIILNLFYGTAVNAAWGVASQVKGVFGRFASSFQTATTPQIMKLYAANEYSAMFDLTRNVSKYAVYLICIIGIPLFLEVDYILSLWLVDVPPYASLFVRLMILQVAIDASSFSVSRSIVATGRIKESCIVGLIVQFVVLILVYVILYYTKNITLAMYIQIIPMFFTYAYMLYLLNKFIGAPVLTYIPQVFTVSLKVIVCSLPLPLFLHFILGESVSRLLLVTISSVLMLSLCVLFIGVDKQTRVLIYSKLNHYLRIRQ